MYHYAYDGVMSAEIGFLRGKIPEKHPEKGVSQSKKSFLYIIIPQRNAKVKQTIRKSFNQDKKFDFYR